MMIEQIFTSPGHNYFGHYGREPDTFPIEEKRAIDCVAGRGIRGDRFFDYKDDYQGQITFFSREVFQELEREFGLTNKSPAVLRRNVIVSGVQLNDLVGLEFELQGVQLRGTVHCKPCLWMDRAFAPGTEKFLSLGKGGLRARLLTDGRLSVGDAQLKILQPA